jgi:hypothetical protein
MKKTDVDPVMDREQLLEILKHEKRGVDLADYCMQDAKMVREAAIRIY